LLFAHMGFGASTGLSIGLAVERLLTWLRAGAAPSSLSKEKVGSTWTRKQGQIIVVAIAVGLCGYMARGNLDKLRIATPHVAANIKGLSALVAKNPEDWNHSLNLREIDFELLQLLQDRVKSPHERALLKLRPAERFSGNGHPTNMLALQINAAAMTGVGIVGVTPEHGPPNMTAAWYPYDYRASLFWQSPTVDLLDQMAPDWILLDPEEVSAPLLDRVMAIPGMTSVRTLRDDAGRARILLHYTRQAREQDRNSRVARLGIEPEIVRTTRFGLARVPATIEADSAGASKLMMEVVDDRGQTANIMDMPIVSPTPIGRDRYELGFSMIQPGRWNVYFVDSVSRARLNQVPVQVEVRE